MTLVLQGVVSGLLFGGVYSLMAVGLTLIFGVMRVVNFAHGDMMVWGMYVAYMLATRAGVDPYVGFVVCAGALFALGFLVQRGLVDRIISAPHEMQILMMLGVALVLENVALIAFGPEPTRVRSPLAAAAVWLGPIFVDVARLVTFVVAVALTLSLWVFLFKTDLGRTIRAAADNTYGALVIGTDVRRVYAVAFGVGAACVGAAGALVSPILPFQPPTGLSLSVASFNIVIIGGMGSLLGAFVGGLLVSLAESLGAVFLKPSLKELFSAIIGYLGFRFGLRGFYFVLLTVAFAEICRIAVSNIDALGGPLGLYITFTGNPRQFQFQDGRAYYYIALALMLVATMTAWAIERRRFGVYLAAIREDEAAAEALGVNGFKYKILAMIVSSFLTGLGGTFYAFYLFSLQPNTLFGIPLSVEIIIRPIVGGAGTLLGPILGSFILTPLAEISRLYLGQGGLHGAHLIAYGVLLIGVVLFLPEGAYPRLKRALARPTSAER